MLAGTDILPLGGGWQFEFKWDGVRVIVVWDGQNVRLLSRNGNDFTASWPEVLGIGGDLGEGPAVLDGELVVMNEERRPDFGLLQQRLHVSDPLAVAGLAGHLPATLLLFDVINFAGQDTRDLPLSDRRTLLERLELDGPAWKVPPVFVGEGEATLDAAERLGLEGIVAKRLSSTYTSGKRGSSWRKIKIIHRDEFVICGWTAGSGRRSSSIGALVLGAHHPLTDELVPVGSVGTGMDDAELDRLRNALEAEETSQNPFPDGAIRADARWCTPTLVCEVNYSGWTREGMLRHPSYAGLRVDKSVSEVALPGMAPHETSEQDH